MVDVWPGTSHTAGNALDEAGHLTHDVDTVQSLAERSINLGGNLLAIRCLALPLPLDGSGLRPVAVGIGGGSSVGCCVVDASVDNLVILEDGTDVDLGGTVGGGSGELHHDTGVGGGLNVDEVPAGS